VSYGFLPGAEVEYWQAVKFYEDQRPGLGARLIKEFERTIQFADASNSPLSRVVENELRFIFRRLQRSVSCS
jgi:hypothetical protein